MRLIDVDALIMALRLEYPMMPMFKDSREEWGIKTEGYRKAEEIINEAPSIDIVRCKECVSYCGDGAPCLWGLKTGEMGFCHHGYRGGDAITAEQTEPQTCEECEYWNDIEDGCADRHGCKFKPQTE